MPDTPNTTPQYRGSFRDPLARSAGHALVGALVGGLNAPKGELLQYVLGGAGIGGAAGLGTTLGSNLGQHAANHISNKYQLTGNSNAVSQLGLPITGAITGGLLSLPVIYRINQELQHNTEQRKKEKTARATKSAAYLFGEKLAQGPIGSISPPQLPSNQTKQPAPNVNKNVPPIFNLRDMSNNSARVGGGILSAAAGGIGAAGTGIAAGATNAWNAVTPKSMNTSQGWSQGVNDVFNSASDFAQKGVGDVVGGLGGDTNYNSQTAWDHLDKGFNDPSVDPTSQNIAWAAGHGGHAAWNLGTALANPAKATLGWAPKLNMLKPTVNIAGTAGTAGRVLNNLDTAGNLAVDMPVLGSGIWDTVSQAQQPSQQTPEAIQY